MPVLRVLFLVAGWSCSSSNFLTSTAGRMQRTNPRRPPPQGSAAVGARPDGKPQVQESFRCGVQRSMEGLYKA